MIVVPCPWKHCVLICSSIMRLCPQSNAVIGCAWTCLYVPQTLAKRDFQACRTMVFQHTPSQKTPQWNFPTLFESITRKKSVCLLFLPGILQLHSVTLFSTESGTDTHRQTLDFLVKLMKLTLLWVQWLQLPLKGLMSWLQYYPLQIPCKPLSCFNEAKVIFVYVTLLKELIAEVMAMLQCSVFYLFIFMPCFFFYFCAISAAERLISSLQAIVSVPPP